jgi:hypothetical protein
MDEGIGHDQKVSEDASEQDFVGAFNWSKVFINESSSSIGYLVWEFTTSSKAFRSSRASNAD